MTADKYEVSVSEQKFDDGTFGFRAIEVVPPISKALAGLICEKVIGYLDTMPRDSDVSAYAHTELVPYGFCDEGASVSTLFKFKMSPTFEGGAVDIFGTSQQLQSFVENQLSPSGVTIKS